MPEKTNPAHVLHEQGLWHIVLMITDTHQVDRQISRFFPG
jgi:hypothetical protein